MKRMFAKNKEFDGRFDTAKFNGAPCAFFDGIHDYFNLNEEAFKAKNPGMHWNGPCASIKYQADPEGIDDNLTQDPHHSLLWHLGFSCSLWRHAARHQGTWTEPCLYLVTLILFLVIPGSPINNIRVSSRYSEE
jgi:hypothetical protein